MTEWKPLTGYRDANGKVYGLDDLTMCPICGGHELVGWMGAATVQCNDCGTTLANLVDDPDPCIKAI